MVSAVIQLDETATVTSIQLDAALDRSQFFTMYDTVKAQMGHDVASCAWAPPEVMYLMYTSGSTGKPKGCIVPSSGVWHRFK